MMKSLKDVEDECNIDLARRILAENNQAFSKIMRCIKRFPNNQEVKLQSLKSMAALTQGYPDIVTVEGLALTCDMLEQVILFTSLPTGIPAYQSIYFYRNVLKPFL